MWETGRDIRGGGARPRASSRGLGLPRNLALRRGLKDDRDPNTASRRHDRQSGTTLVEALVVVAITALVSLIGFPRLQQGLTRLAQRQTVSAVAERLREARAAALRGDRPVAFRVAANGRAYGWTGGARWAVPSGIAVGPGGGSIAFFADGSSNGGAVWILAGRRPLYVQVAPATGAVALGRK